MREMLIQARNRVNKGMQWLKAEAPPDWLFRLASWFGGKDVILTKGWLKNPESILVAIYGEHPEYQIKDRLDEVVGPATFWSVAFGLRLTPDHLERFGFLLPRYYADRAWENNIHPFVIKEWEKQLYFAWGRTLLPNYVEIETEAAAA